MIPARFASTRFPGKPLVELLGKPMVLWVAELSAMAVGRSNVFVATEDERVKTVVTAGGFGAIMTSDTAMTGTDRLAEASTKIDYDIIVNVQGDEPLVEPEDINHCIKLKAGNPDVIFNGFTWMSDSEDPNSVNIPKVLTTEDDEMIYISRSALPGIKDPKKQTVNYKKQVCIYGFSKEDLAAFSGFGRKSTLESLEDIEILRFLELGRRVEMFETRPGSLAVDVEEDVVVVEAALRAKHSL